MATADDRIRTGTVGFLSIAPPMTSTGGSTRKGLKRKFADRSLSILVYISESMVLDLN